MTSKISIKNKLIGIIIISLLGLAVLLTFVVIKKSQTVQIKDKFDQLETIEFTKHAELKKYFTTLKNLLTITAQNSQTKLALNSLKTSFHNIKNETKLHKNNLIEDLSFNYNINYLNLVNFDVPNTQNRLTTKEYIPKTLNALVAQKIFITDNPAKIGEKNLMVDTNKYKLTYINNHKLFHPIFNNLLKTFNLYDIFLIDTKGNIVYSTFKEKDFATNLIHGIYKDSSLASVFKKALQLKQTQIAFEDFKPYLPSYNKAASFISTPIYFNNKIIGVLAFQLPNNQLTNILQFNKNYEKAGLGKTGEAYLVGSDYKMRTNSRFIESLDNDIVQKLNTTIGIWEVKTKSVKAVLHGDNTRSYHIIKDYRNEEVLSVYHIVHPFDKKAITWALIAEIDKKEVLEPTKEIIKYMIISTTVLVFIFLFISLYLINNILNKPLSNFQHSLEHFFLFLKGEEKKTKFLKITSDDEIGKMSKFINLGITDVKKSLKKENENIWIKEGIRKLNQLFIQTNNINDITENTLIFLSDYIKNINVAVIYLYDKEKEELTQNATYSYTNTKHTKTSYKLKEGIVGQTAYQKSEILLINRVHNDSDMILHTGTKQTIPRSTYTFALIYSDILFGVIELGSITNLAEKEIELLRSATKIIAIALSTALKNNEVQILLKKSNTINRNLNAKQKEIEDANTKMQYQQQQLEISNTHLEEQQLQLEEANAAMEEQQQRLEIQNKELNIAQKEVEKKAKDLELSNKYKTEFMANMSHELRTPLNAVILLSELMSHNRNKNLTFDDIKKASTINTAGKDLLRLIDDILDLSKVEAGKIDIIVDEFMPNELLEELKNLYEQSAINRNIEFNIKDTYNDLIFSDKHRISQILKNLISNALKFTTKGSIDVNISKSEDKNLPIKISVKDTGIGIPEDKLSKIFEAFTQADGSTSRKYGGTGLGLSITKELSQLLGGKVLLDSKLNEGSIFTILLPNINQEDQIDLGNEEIEIEDIPTDIYNEEFNSSIEDIIINDVDLTDLNILIVDDDIKNIFVLDGVLQDYNASVFTAYNGEEAIKSLKQNSNIDIILMDVMMPVMDGYEAISKIRNDKTITNIPIIAVSAKTLQEDIDKCMTLGANDYVSKPINMESLINIIEVWSNKK